MVRIAEAPSTWPKFVEFTTSPMLRPVRVVRNIVYFPAKVQMLLTVAAKRDALRQRHIHNDTARPADDVSAGISGQTRGAGSLRIQVVLPTKYWPGAPKQEVLKNCTNCLPQGRSILIASGKNIRAR